MKTLHLVIIVGIIILANQIVPIYAELSNLSAPVTNDKCVNKIMDSEKRQSIAYDENKAIELAKNSQELKSKVVGYQYSFDHTSKYFVIDGQACTAAWRYVEVVFNLQDSHGGILSQVIVTEDTQLTRVITASMQQYSPPNVQMTSPNAAYMTPQRGLDSKIALVMLFGIISGTALLVIYFSRRSKDVIPKGVAAARIFFAVFSMMLLSVMVFLPFDIIHNDSSDEQIFNATGSIFYIIDYPITHTTSSILEYFGITHGPLENIIGNYVVIIFGIVSVIATYGMWTRKYWSWKMCVSIMFVQLGLCVFSLQQGLGMLIPLFIPALVMLDLFRSDVRNYFQRENKVI